MKSIPNEVIELITLDALPPVSAWMRYKGITQKELAQRLNVSQSTISQICRAGFNRTATIEKVCKALGIHRRQLEIGQ